MMRIRPSAARHESAPPVPIPRAVPMPPAQAMMPIARALTLMLTLLLLSMLALAPCKAVHAQAQPSLRLLEFDQRLGAPLPLDAAFTDQAGAPVSLGRYFGKRPVILVLGYYHCPMLCSTVMNGVLESLRGIDADYEAVAVSIDPHETAADAAGKYASYQGLLQPGRQDRLHLLTGAAGPIADLARAAGFPYQYDPATGQYGHPAGFMIATPDGRISRYFPGVRFDARNARLALVEASAGRLGSLADRLVLLCSHYDPRSGKYNVAVMDLARAGGMATLAALCLLVFLARRRRRA
jgi:protein SCO1/2